MAILIDVALCPKLLSCAMLLIPFHTRILFSMLYSCVADLCSRLEEVGLKSVKVKEFISHKLVTNLAYRKHFNGILGSQFTLKESGVSCLLFHLKTIEVLSFVVGEDQMKIVEHFLESARVLENLKNQIQMKKEEQLVITEE
ncbi:hypothetical protein SLE2022_044600 [Rubroshorea leprosula]